MSLEYRLTSEAAVDARLLELEFWSDSHTESPRVEAQDEAERAFDGILLCGDGCVRCGACFGDAGESCSFEGASVSGGCRDVAVEEEYSKRGAMCGSMLDEKSLAAEVTELFEARGFPGYAARAAAEAAGATALEAWQPCRADGEML